MSSNTSLPHSLNTLLLNQPAKGVESSTCFEGSDLLLILAFEEEPDIRIGIGAGGIALHAIGMRGGFKSLVRARSGTTLRFWRGGQDVQRVTCYRWRTVDVLFNAFVGGLHGSAVDGRTGAEIRHDGMELMLFYAGVFDDVSTEDVICERNA